ncbi:AfsR/SARP family transcriptional regulator [Micromonospora tulbaghiae]|uniref:AfsR/SARP family transcriptional regulator n=1 Tax=Micromonospora tulbaghiae TaxID=479978 RepID=UPI0033CE7209
MRWPRQLMSLLVVLVLLVGPPAVLLAVVDPPISGWPTSRQVRAWVQQPLTEQTLTAALTIGAWLIWLMLAYTVALRVLARLRATSALLRRLPLPTPLQATASGMAGAAVLGITTDTAATAPEHPPQPAAAGTTTLHDGAGPDGTDNRTIADADGISVAGGWLPRDVAIQVSAAASLVWLRRRRDYQPGPASTNQQDSDLAPLPRTVASVQAALADTPAPPAQPSSYAITGLHDVLPAGGIGLIGEGALSVGRGLLVTTLLARQHHPAASLIVSSAALISLLGPAAQSLIKRLPLTIVENPDEAARLVRAAERPEHTKVPRQTQGTPSISGHPAVVILDGEDCAGGDLKHLAAASIETAATLIVLGQWPAGPTWHADSAGHLYDPHDPAMPRLRLCVLDHVAATDLLAVIAPVELTAGATAVPVAAPEPMRPNPRLPRQRSHLFAADTPRQRLHVRVLGDPQLLIDGEPLPVRRSAALQILVYLATVHPTGADAAQLTDAIWPGLPHHALTGRLYTALSDLRTSIRDAGGLHVIDHADDRYRLNPAHLDVDLWHLNAALRHATTAITPSTEAWQAVVDAYPADLAEGRAWPWLDPIRETIRRRIIDVCAASAAAEPDPDRALNLLQAGIRIDPYNAALQKRANRLLHVCGDDNAETGVGRPNRR